MHEHIRHNGFYKCVCGHKSCTLDDISAAGDTLNNNKVCFTVLSIYLVTQDTTELVRLGTVILIAYYQ